MITRDISLGKVFRLIEFSYNVDSLVCRSQGRSQGFSKGGGSHCVKHYITRNIVDCFLKEGLQRGEGGVTGTPGPPPRYALGSLASYLCS